MKIPLPFLGFLLLSNLGFSAQRPNVLLICVDDLRPELNCFGKDYIHSPHIDSLAAKGRAFTNHYVQAPTCGASRYALLTGTYGPAGNGALFSRSKKIEHPSLPAHFRANGYTTVSVGKVSHHPGGRGGKDWDDDAQPEMPDSWDRHLLPAGKWQHPRGWMHGLANGEIRGNAQKMDVIQAFDGDDNSYPDGAAVDETLNQLKLLAEAKKPFFLATGILRPHLPFGAPKKYLDLYKDAELPPIPHPEKPEGTTTWHKSGEFMKYNRWDKDPNEDPAFATEVRKHYAACVSYADSQVGKIIKQLNDLGLAEDTVIILWGDHGWHLGEHSIWGKHALFEESLRAPLIISSPQVAQAGSSTKEIVESIDLFPTLCDLTGLTKPAFLNGHSLLPLLKSATAPSEGIAVSYHNKARTIRSATQRLIAHKDGQLELYDHNSPGGETKNLSSSQPEEATRLLEQLNQRYPK
ncbi:sulfatase [Akkermansiaceae bacterium]|nr:sulfatase [Akkermansiaceae bacterium]MDC1404064.1 sulfatase [Akkermansiaceae bacterium]